MTGDNKAEQFLLLFAGCRKPKVALANGETVENWKQIQKVKIWFPPAANSASVCTITINIVVLEMLSFFLFEYMFILFLFFCFYFYF